jgi:hypothetical protein
MSDQTVTVEDTMNGARRRDFYGVRQTAEESFADLARSSRGSIWK